LTNDFDTKNLYYQKLLKENHPYDWVVELKNRVKILTLKTETQNQFSETIIDIIKNTRILKKLPEIEIKLNKEAKPLAVS
jgi:hypothetical protein